MEVTILNVAGLEQVAQYQYLPLDRVEKSDGLKRSDVALMHKLVLAGDDHAKIMRMVVVWLLVRAPRYWWQQFDTYRIGVEKLSGSTMHTLLRDGVRERDFTPDTPRASIVAVGQAVEAGDLVAAKAALPEGFLQNRLVMCSYQALRRMWIQRRNHKLKEWHEFLSTLRILPLANNLIFCENGGNCEAQDITRSAGADDSGICTDTTETLSTGNIARPDDVLGE